MDRVRIGAAGAALALVAGCATAASTTTAAAGGPPNENCPPTKGAGYAIVDYVDFIQAFDHQYDAWFSPKPVRVRKSQLGRVVLRSTCSLSALNDRTHKVPGEPRDGNTAFLPVGTPIYAIDGWSPRCRLAARSAGKLKAYFAMRNDTKHAHARACALHH